MGEMLYYQPDKQDAEREINLLLTNAYEEAVQIITREKVNTERLAQALLVEETLCREQVLELMDKEVAKISPDIDTRECGLVA